MPIQPTSGAALQPISLTAPAFKGLNKQNESSILGPEWATTLDNCVFDFAGRVASRKGWNDLTGSAISGTPVIRQLFEYLKKDGTSTIISAANNKLFSGGAPTFSDITGTGTITDNNWQFINYNGFLLSWQSGHSPRQWSGSGSTAAISASSGSVPLGNCAAAGSGRVWASDADGQTIKYSALLDHTKWAIADGGGSIDMSSVWPNGMDSITAITFFNNLLVVFGKRSIVLWTDGAGSALGLDPAAIIVADAVTGSGCIARDTVREVEGPDLLFLSDQGLQSIQRVIQEKSNPISNVSANVRDYMMTAVRGDTLSQIRSVYSPEESMYLLSCPNYKAAFCFNTKGKLDDGTFRATTWTLAPSAALRSVGGTLYMAAVSPGRLGAYTGYTDDSAKYTMDYASGWLDLGQDLTQFLKILKSISAIVYITTSAAFSVKWAFDFGDFSSRGVTLEAGGTGEWGLMEWGLGEWSGGLSLRNLSIAAGGVGQYIRVGLVASISGAQVAIQQIKPIPKIGRLAR